jgi:hypothetical protein
MDHLSSTGYRGPVFIVDDNFIGNRRHVTDLLKSLAVWQKDNDYPFTFFTEASVNLAQESELLDLMAQCGFNMVFLGIETPDVKTLSDTGKGQNVKQDLLESVKTIQSRGIEVLAGFILGFDSDTPDIFDRQIDFISKAGIPTAMMGLMIALPGTRLFRRLASEGRILSECSGNNTNELELNFIPVMDKQLLVDGYKRVLAALYEPRAYFERSLTLLSRIPNRQLAGRRVEKGDMGAFARSIIHQGFSRYGHLYFGFLLKSAIRTPKHFAVAVNLAVKGHHFITLTRATMLTNELGSYGARLIERFETEMNRVAKESALAPAVVIASGERVRKQIVKKYRQISRSVRHYAHDEYNELLARLDQCMQSSVTS